MENKKRKSLIALLVYILVYIAYTSIYVSRVNLSVAEPGLEALGVFDAAGYGVIGGLFSTVYATGRLVNGAIGDRTPPYIMLSVGLGVAGLANLLIGFLPGYVGILLLWSVNAYAQSMLWSSVLATVSYVYQGAGLKRMTSLMVTAVASGNIVAILLGGWLVTAFGVSFAFFVPGALNIILGALILVFVRFVPAPSSEVVNTVGHRSLFSLLSDREMQLMTIPSVLHGVLKENVSVWMVAFVVYTFKVDLSTSSYYVLLIPVIGLVGRLLYPLALKLAGERENTVSIVGFAVAALASLSLLFAEYIGIVGSVIALGIIYAASSMVNTSITSIFPLSYMESGNVASVSGLLDFASYLGAGISGAVFGVVIKHFGYQPMFATFTLSAIISILVLLLINRLRRGGTISENN